MDKVEAEVKAVDRIVYNFSRQVNRADERNSPSIELFAGTVARQLQAIHSNIEFYSIFLSDHESRQGRKELTLV